MKKIQCEICGSSDIRKVGGGVFQCQQCGIQYSREEAIKLLSEAAPPSFAPAPPRVGHDDIAVASVEVDSRRPAGLALKLENRLSAGDKLGAIAVYREATGAGLADAKAAVEEFARKQR